MLAKQAKQLTDEYHASCLWSPPIKEAIQRAAESGNYDVTFLTSPHSISLGEAQDICGILNKYGYGVSKHHNSEIDQWTFCISWRNAQ